MPFALTSRSLRPVLARSHVSRGDAIVRYHTMNEAYQLLCSADKAGASEDRIFDDQVAQVKQWWNSARYKDIKRPYSAESVVSKRGTLTQSYPSSLMAQKLFKLLQERAAAAEPVHTSR